jgi:NAD(P)H dehydrogenase (quinone)
MAANVLIVFYSRAGHCEALARAVAEGAQDSGADVRVRRVAEIVGGDVMEKVPGWREHSDRMLREYGRPSQDDVLWADAIVLGSPTRFGNMCAEVKAFVDSLGSLWIAGKLNGKVGSAFTSTQTTHGGNESTLITSYNPMAHLGMILVPTGYADPVMFGAGTPYGASTVTGPDGAMPTSADLAVAHFQGRRVTQVADALKVAGITQTTVEQAA